MVAVKNTLQILNMMSSEINFLSNLEQEFVILTEQLDHTCLPHKVCKDLKWDQTQYSRQNTI